MAGREAWRTHERRGDAWSVCQIVDEVQVGDGKPDTCCRDGKYEVLNEKGWRVSAG